MKWNIKKANPLKVAAYKNRLGITALMAKVLINRNIDIDTAAKSCMTRSRSSKILARSKAQ